MLYDVVENIVNNHDAAQHDYYELKHELMTVLTIDTPFTEEEYPNLSKEYGCRSCSPRHASGRSRLIC